MVMTASHPRYLLAAAAVAAGLLAACSPAHSNVIAGHLILGHASREPSPDDWA